MITYVEGDLFRAVCDAKVNTVNCVGVMGKGVALGFKTRYPELFAQYHKDCKKGLYVPGCVKPFRVSPSLVVYNAATKNHWRNPSRYEWVEACLHDLVQEVDRSPNIHTVATPPMGCGNGGLIWRRVKKLYERYLTDCRAEFLVYEP